MAVLRTMLALLVAASVAMLPFAAGALASKGTSQEAAEMSASEPMHDCCPPTANPCDKAIDDCRSMAGCALKCFSFASALSSPLEYPLAPAGVVLLFEGNGFRAQSSSPPFRPPRI